MVLDSRQSLTPPMRVGIVLESTLWGGLETHAVDIANAIREFLGRAVASGKRNAA